MLFYICIVSISIFPYYLQFSLRYEDDIYKSYVEMNHLV